MTGWNKLRTVMSKLSMHLYNFSAMMNKKYVTINAIFITGDTTTAAPESGNIQIIILQIQTIRL